MGQVHLAWDDERTSREEILASLAKAGFRSLELVSGAEDSGLTPR